MAQVAYPGRLTAQVPGGHARSVPTRLVDFGCRLHCVLGTLHPTIVHDKGQTTPKKVTIARTAHHLMGTAGVAATLSATAYYGRRAGHRPKKQARHAIMLGAQRQQEFAVGSNAAAHIASPSSDKQGGYESKFDEWLLVQELPEPLRPILGSSAWANFTAALMQMGVVAGLAALGTLLEQGGPSEFYARQYPTFSGVILTLGLDHVYTSPLFLALLAWLAASIVACTGTTQLPLAKRAQRFNFRSVGSMRRTGTFLIRVDCGGEIESALCTLDPTEVQRLDVESARSKLLGLQTALQQRGFVVRVDDEACPSRLAASRGLLGKFAPMVVHLALLLCLAGGAVGLLFGASSEVMVGDGGRADLGAALEQGRRAKGPLYDALNPSRGLMQGTLLHVEDFRIQYRDSGEIEQFFSNIAVEDAQTSKRLYSDEIYVNKPLRYGGATVYQADWGIDRLQMYLNGVQIVVPLKQLPDDGGVRAWGAFLPEEFMTAKDPSTIKHISNPNVGVVFVVENLRNVQVYGSDKNLAGILRSPDAKVDRKMEGMPIQFGESIIVEGSELRLDKIVGSTGLIVKNDPGVPLVYLGYALLMPATLLSVLPFVQVWASVGDGDEPGKLLISGRANRNQPAFEDEMKAMVVSGVL